MSDELDPDRLRRLLAEAAGLPRAIEPERDAWPPIRERIESRRVRAIPGRPLPDLAPSWRRVARLTAAAAAVLIVTASVLVLRPGRGKSRPSDITVGPTPTPASLSPASAAPLSAVLAQYEEAARELEAAVRARELALEPATRQVVRRSLAAIDSAIADLRAALEQDPGSTAVVRYLAAAYERKLDFLKRARGIPARGL